MERQSRHRAEIGAPELEYRHTDPCGAVSLKDAEHRHYQAAYKEHAVDHEQRPQLFGGLVLRLDRQPGEEGCERHQRVAQQVKAEEEPHLLKVQQFTRLLSQTCEAHRGELRKIDNKYNGGVDRRKSSSGMARAG